MDYRILVICIISASGIETKDEIADGRLLGSVSNPFTTVTSTSTETPTTFPDLSAVFPCIFQRERNYSPPMDVCPSFFYQCANGRTFMQHCPPTLFYDRILDRCDYHYLVAGCIGYNATTLNSTEQCENKTPGFYPNPVSCTSYLACLGDDDLGVVVPCGGGFVYDADNGHCTLPELVAWPCGYKMERYLMLDECTDRPDGWMLSSNCRTFQRCKKGAIEALHCPLGEAFNRWTGETECHLMVHVPGCAPPDDIAYSNICQLSKFGVFPVSDSAEVGLVCLHGLAYPVRCHDQGFSTFDLEQRKCVP